MTAVFREPGTPASPGDLLDDFGPCRVAHFKCSKPATVPVVKTVGQSGPLPYPLSFTTLIFFACPFHAKAMVDPVFTDGLADLPSRANQGGAA